MIDAFPLAMYIYYVADTVDQKNFAVEPFVDIPATP